MGDTTTKPPDTTTKLPDTTTKPPDTTTKPPDTTIIPSDTTTIPTDTTTKPPDTTTKPLSRYQGDKNNEVSDQGRFDFEETTKEDSASTHENTRPSVTFTFIPSLTCQGVIPWTIIQGIKQWCENNCHRGFCPKNVC